MGKDNEGFFIELNTITFLCCFFGILVNSEICKIKIDLLFSGKFMKGFVFSVALIGLMEISAAEERYESEFKFKNWLNDKSFLRESTRTLVVKHCQSFCWVVTVQKLERCLGSQ